MVGIFSKTTDSSLIKASGYAGLDFIIIDQEHGPVDNVILQNHIHAAKLSGITPIVRVKELNHNLIGTALDLGAEGVQIPNITSEEEASLAINAAKFYPEGERGVCRFVNSANFGSTPKSEYFKDENKKLLILQVEGLQGIENIDSIIALKNFDILFLGPYDLSQSLGIPGDIENDLIQDKIIDINKKIVKAGKKMGVFVDSSSQLKKMKTLDISYIAYSVDINIFLEACKVIKNE